MSENDAIQMNATLRIAFPKSREDHRLQLVEVNGLIFAIVHAPLESLGPIQLNCEIWNLVLLAPIKSRSDILISASNIICLNEIRSEEGVVNIEASHRLVQFTASKPSAKHREVGRYKEFRFDDDPGSFLKYYQLFTELTSCIRSGRVDSYSNAREKFILCLCALAEKMEGKGVMLNIHKVFDVWGIPSFNPA